MTPEKLFCAVSMTPSLGMVPLMFQLHSSIHELIISKLFSALMGACTVVRSTAFVMDDEVLLGCSIHAECMGKNSRCGQAAC